MDLHLSSRAKPYFERAGLQLPREVPVHPAVPTSHPAHFLLAQLGGVHIGVGFDDTMLKDIRNDIAFGYAEPYGSIDKWETILGTRLVGVAETHHRHGTLYLAEDERFFTLSEMHDAMGFEGLGFLNAIDNILFGRSIPMIRQDQESVSWYGMEYSHGDVGLYRYDIP